MHDDETVQILVVSEGIPFAYSWSIQPLYSATNRYPSVKSLRRIRLLKLTEVTALSCITPELEHSERHKPNRADRYTRWYSVIMSGIWWLMEMGIRKFIPGVAVISVVEILTFGVVISVVPLIRPCNVEASGFSSDTIIKIEMNRFGIERTVELGRSN